MNPAQILSAIVVIFRDLFAPRRELASQVVPVEPPSAEVLQRKAVRLWE